MAVIASDRWSFCGRRFSPAERALIREVVADCSGLSRLELGHTVAELVGWRRPSGALKARECREFLERLEQADELALPAKRPGRPMGSRTAVPHTALGDQGAAQLGSVEDLGTILLEPVRSPEEHLAFRELVGRHHYLGYRVPFGAHVKYLIWGSLPERAPLGCLQFSSAAWRMAARDQWIGWDERARKRNLPRVINNSRFLLLPWVRVRNLASTVLSLGIRRVASDWEARYGVEPLLAETLVDPSRYSGGCYRASNWIELGQTTGRGRMDRDHRRHGAEPKLLFVYPLLRDTAKRLRER